MSEIDLKKVGGSDAPAIAGISRWKSPIDIWRRIVEGAETEDKALMRRGRRMEPVLREEYQEVTGATLLGPQSLGFDGKPFLRASLDDLAEINGERRVVELKTANFRMAHEWGTGDNVPPEYLAQVNWYMRAAGLDKCDLAVLLGGAEFRIYPIAADAELQEMLLDAACRFWTDYVETKKPPPPDSSESYKEFLAGRYPSHRAPLLESTPAIDALVAKLRAAEAAFEKDSDEIEAAKNGIKAALGDSEGVAGQWGKILWRANKDGQVTDWKALCAELKPDPELVRKYTTTKNGARVFRATWRNS